MKALVKEKAEPGLWLVDVPEPEVGPGEVKIRPADRDLRHRPAYPEI